MERHKLQYNSEVTSKVTTVHYCTLLTDMYSTLLTDMYSIAGQFGGRKLDREESLANLLVANTDSYWTNNLVDFRLLTRQFGQTILQPNFPSIRYVLCVDTYTSCTRVDTM